MSIYNNLTLATCYSRLKPNISPHLFVHSPCKWKFKNIKIMWKNLIIATTLLFITGISELFANDYSIPDIRIEVEILEDGTVRFTEHLTYHFDGTFSWADHRFPKDGFSEVSNIMVFEDQNDYINSNTEETGTFSVSQSNRFLIIKWYYNAIDEPRTFSISYDLAGALTVGEEWVQFYWIYLASGRNKSTSNLEIDISLPSEATAGNIYAWSRIPDHLYNLTTFPDRISFRGESISRNQAVSIRTLVPRSLFDADKVSVNEPKLTLERVTEDEELYVMEQEHRTERDEYYASITQPVTIAIIAVSIGIFVFLFRKYGRRYSTKTISDRETIVPPNRTSPAIIGRLMSASTTTGNHLSATLFDLARRGWFRIHEEKKEGGFFSSSSSVFRISKTESVSEEISRLSEWEQMMIRFVNGRIDMGSDTFDKLFSGSSAEVSKWYSGWRKKVKEEFESRNWIDTESKKGVIINVVLQIFLVVFSIIMLIFGTVFALIALIATTLMMVSSFAIQRRTKEGQETFRRWLAYRNGLKNADKRTINMEMLGMHFIYATALGLSQSQINTLIKKSQDNATTIFPWIVLMQGSNTSPAAVATSISALSASGTSSFTGSVSGGGASMGSAGGGASSGAG